MLQGNGPAVSSQATAYRPARDIPVGVYQNPQFGRADVSQAVRQPPDPGECLNTGVRSWVHTPAGNLAAGLANGITGPRSGRLIDAGGNTSDSDSSGNGQAGGSSGGSSLADKQPPGLSKIGYFEIPINPNQAFGELLGIQERNEDGSLEVTNGPVVTFSYKDGSAKTVTVTGDDIAYIDAKTGEVVIQKSF
jgi:hypothetical protein